MSWAGVQHEVIWLEGMRWHLGPLPQLPPGTREPPTAAEVDPLGGQAARTLRELSHGAVKQVSLCLYFA